MEMRSASDNENLNGQPPGLGNEPERMASRSLGAAPRRDVYSLLFFEELAPRKINASEATRTDRVRNGTVGGHEVGDPRGGHLARRAGLSYTGCPPTMQSSTIKPVTQTSSRPVISPAMTVSGAAALKRCAQR